MSPTHFRPKVGAAWAPWVSGSIDTDILRMKLKAANGQPTYVNGCEVYELKFSNGSEWSVKGGWKQ